MHDENLNGAKKLFFIALWIDIAVTVIVVISSMWEIGILKDLKSGQISGVDVPVSVISFWDNFALLMIATTIGVGLGLVKWLNACYRYAKEAIGATGFANEKWTASAWVIPIFNLFKPYQVISEIYKAGSQNYAGTDGWKKKNGSGAILTWWIFWAITHFVVWIVSKQVFRRSFKSDLTIPQIIDMVEFSLWVCIFSLLVAVLWFVVANHLTGRLLDRERSRLVRGERFSGVNYGSLYPNNGVPLAMESRDPSANNVNMRKAVIPQQTQPPNTPPVSETQMQAPERNPTLIPSAVAMTDKENTPESDEERIYATALSEIQTDSVRPGVWAKAFAESEGVENRCKALYIRLRVQQEKERLDQERHASHLAEVEAAQRKPRAFQNVVDGLSSCGYETKRTMNGWSIREPLGGRVKLKSDQELLDYAQGKTEIPGELSSPN